MEVIMKISFQLDDIQDIKWIKSFPRSERLGILRQCITLGRVMFSVQPKLICTPDAYMEPFTKNIDQHLENVKNVMNTSSKYMLDPIIGRFDRLCSQIDDLTSISSKSALKGRMGENLIASGIKIAFPGIEIKDMSKKDHETDFHLTIPNPKIQILLEIKTYTNSVPSSQIAKLYQDINFTGFKFAIMVSTTSGIAKHPTNFDWEIYQDCLIIYLGNAGLNGFSVVAAIQFIMAVNQLQMLSGSSKLDTLELDNFAKSLAEHLEVLSRGLNKYSRLKYNFSKFEAAMSNGLRDLYTEILEMESELKNIVHDLGQMYNQQLLPLTTSMGQIEKFQPASDKEIWKYIESQKESGKHICYSQIYEFVKKLGLTIIIKDNEWMIFMADKKIVTKTESTKCKCYLVFNIQKGEQYQFTGHEKIRNQQLLIQICRENYDGIEKMLRSRSKVE